MTPERILLLGDERRSRCALRSILESRHYEVRDGRTEHTGRLLLDSPIDLVVLDAALPSGAVVELCKQIRAASEVGLIVVAKCDSEAEKIAVLDAGADDYLSKPCSLPELLARVRVILRRMMTRSSVEPQVVQLEGLRIDLASRRVIAQGRQIRLTPKEFSLLHYLIANSNATVSHIRLLRTVWGHQNCGQASHLRVFINQLRRKIEPDPAHPRFLVTEPWVGYRFEIPGRGGIEL